MLASEEQLERLIEALLSLAGGERALDRREPVDLTAVTEQALAVRRPEIERHGLLLNATLDRAGLEGNPQLVERLVANLVDNAIRTTWPAVALPSRRQPGQDRPSCR